jgi:hypothetical protein
VPCICVASFVKHRAPWATSQRPGHISIRQILPKRQEVLRHRTGVLIKLSVCRPTSATSVEEAADACDDHAYEHRDAGEALRFAPAALVSAVSGWGGLSRSG